ncbi:DUF962 domain-containing protein [Lutibacter sp.]|uniref:DUF962 domain-containing protein n=1 Tax=Lutibacter sp. TaxID=1925666 RepID=UPI002733C871|nr:DUF962 domain-containing protein [Lutibacter sp.]MDP3312250.1 DUF962 domain-containing protein [Lutibacter sp.]
MNQRIQSFKDFYPYYLKEHSNSTCRLLHVIGTTLVFALAITAIYHNIPKLWILVPIAGYGFAWAGHFFFEKNKPATFQYPLWSLRSDFKMYFQIISSKISLDSTKDSI